MTCIVGVISDSRIIMGGDSCASSEDDWITVGNPKVFSVGDFIIGGADSFRMIDLLRYRLSVTKQVNGQPDDVFIRTDFINDVITCFKSGGWLGNGEGGIIQGGNFLVGYHGRLYEVQDDFSVLDCPAWGSAIGSGYLAARASLYTTRQWNDAEQRVMAALEAAEAIVPSVRSPFVVVREKLR